MGFTFAFRPQPPPTGHVASAELPSRDDDYFPVIVKTCSLLEEVEGSEFVMSGFGRRWAMDVGYDMSTLLEQTPELARAVEQRLDVEVDLYSQGVECRLEFHPVGDDVHVRCTSATAWVPDPEVEVVSRSDLLDMIRRLHQEVARAVSQIDPQLVGIPPFGDWLRIDRTLP